ncbi:DDE_3 domain-containing protein [Trichonephila clavipes]|nr:DDE_3 domain-containing protein [Trichonephila clavipes]
MFVVGQEKALHGLPRQIMTNISCKQQVETEQPIRCGMKDSFFWQQEKDLKPNNPKWAARAWSILHVSQRLCGLMVWAGISIFGRTDLHIIWNSNLTAQRYANEILRPHIVPYDAIVRDSYLFMQDNARNHSVHLVENFLEVETIQRMEQPACSPDLNFIQRT